MKNTFGGEKLIFYEQGQSEVSETLDQFEKNNRRLNHEAIYDFLLFNISLPPNTLFEGINTLFPGQEFPSLENREYQELVQVAKTRFQSDKAFALELEKILQSYFDQKVDTIKPKALMLSGGIDSAIIGTYLPKDTVCVTWGGWGEGTTDVVFAKKNFERSGFGKHIITVVDYDKDLELYREAIKKTGQLFSFAASVPHLRMSQALSEHFGQGKSYQLFMGQNADTISGAYLATEHAYYWPKINRLWSWLPVWKNLYQKKRKWFLPSSTNPIELMAFFHSCGLYPGQWLSVPSGYFEKKLEQIKEQIGRSPKRFRDHILMHELMTEARRNQYVQNNIPAMYGAEVATPYYAKEVVRLFMEVPFWLRWKGWFDKSVLKELAAIRGVPAEVIAKGKKGLSYGYKNFLSQKRHIPIWDDMEKNELLNEFVDIALVREKYQNNFPTFDLLMSLHFFFKEVWEKRHG